MSFQQFFFILLYVWYVTCYIINYLIQRRWRKHKSLLLYKHKINWCGRYVFSLFLIRFPFFFSAHKTRWNNFPGFTFSCFHILNRSSIYILKSVNDILLLCLTPSLTDNFWNMLQLCLRGIYIPLYRPCMVLINCYMYLYRRTISSISITLIIIIREPTWISMCVTKGWITFY